MAKTRSFVTGANAKIKIFNNTLAYCSDVAYNVTVQTIPIEAMGKYEVHSNEPVGYTVDGTFSIIRYTKNAVANDVANSGNSPKNIIDSENGGHMQQHLDPSQLLISQTFDLEIYEKHEDSETRIFKVTDCRVVRRGMSLNKRGVMVDNYAFVGEIASDSDNGENNFTSNSGTEDLT